MKVFDCFPYWREAWAIELRLRLWELLNPGYEYVPVAFVGDRTHRGDPLPEPYVDPRVGLVRVALPGPGNWEREMQQRDAVRQLTLQGIAAPNDLILLCDADEIVNPAVVGQIVERLNSTHPFIKLAMSMYVFGARWMHPSPWRHPGAFYARNMPEWPSATIRMATAGAAVGAAGWHFTYVDDLESKLRAFAHEEMDNPENLRDLQQARETGKLGTYQLLDLPLHGPAGSIFREIVR
jgi:hypothetical protein